MVFNKLKSTAKERGFTIVELLIVIVVIAILAAITIVAYNGVQQKAKTTQAQTNAVQAQKVAEAYNADNSTYPGLSADFTGALAKTAKLPTSITIKPVTAAGTDATAASNAAAALNASVSTATSTIYFAVVGSPATGGVIYYYDFSTGTVAVNHVFYGNATTGSTFIVPAS